MPIVRKNSGNLVRLKRYCIAGLCGFIGALVAIGIFYSSSKSPQRMAAVDVTGLVHHFVKEHATQSMPPVQLRAQVKVFSQQLEQVLHQIAREQHVLLMPKEAVLSDCPDLTTEVERRLAAVEGQGDQ